jgi:hypothetical protein
MIAVDSGIVIFATPHYADSIVTCMTLNSLNITLQETILNFSYLEYLIHHHHMYPSKDGFRCLEI